MQWEAMGRFGRGRFDPLPNFLHPHSCDLHRNDEKFLEDGMPSVSSRTLYMRL